MVWKFLRWLFSGHVFEVAALFLAAIGASMGLAPDKDDILRAHWFFSTAFILTLGRLAYWLTTEQALTPKPLIAAVCFAVLGGSWMAVYQWVESKVPKPIAESITSEQRAALRSRLDSLNTIESYALRLVRVRGGFTDQQLMDRLRQDGLNRQNVLGVLSNKIEILARNGVGESSIEEKFGVLVDEFLASQPENRNRTDGPKLIFSDSPKPSDSRIALVATVFAEFRDYLRDIGFEPPTLMPPIRFESDGAQGIGTIRNPRSADGDALIIGARLADDAKLLRWGFSGYIFGRLLNTAAVQVTDPRHLSATVFADYFASSFSDETDPKFRYDWDDALWDMRKLFGKEFTDHLLLKTIKLFDDLPLPDPKEHFAVYFKNRLMRGVNVMDTRKWPEVNAILTARGWN